MRNAFTRKAELDDAVYGGRLLRDGDADVSACQILLVATASTGVCDGEQSGDV